MGLQRIRHDWATELNWTELDTFFTTDATLKKLITGREPGTQETSNKYMLKSTKKENRKIQRTRQSFGL